MGNFISWVNFRPVHEIEKCEIVHYSKLNSKEWDHQIRQIYKKSNKPENIQPSLTNQVLEGYLNEPSQLAQKPDHEIIFIIDEEGDELIGMVVITPLKNPSKNLPNCAELSQLVIDPKYRLQGYGRILMKAVNDWVEDKDNSFISYYLECTINVESFFKKIESLEEISQLRKYDQINQTHYIIKRFRSKHATIQKEMTEYFDIDD
jgi:GNAT superfamily N-acetyltransferase